MGEPIYDNRVERVREERNRKEKHKINGSYAFYKSLLINEEMEKDSLFCLLLHLYP